MTRKAISLKTKLCAALCQMLRPDETGKLVPIIPHEDALRLSEDQILSLFQWDHYPIRKEAGGADAHYNLQPLLIVEHRTKTATVDQPQIAKIKRVQDWSSPRKPSQIQNRGFRKADKQRSASKPLDRWMPPRPTS